jgi:solute carrier family 25 (mitochondrial carnitine/acylcarnitine transporter), member 20/29
MSPDSAASQSSPVSRTTSPATIHAAAPRLAQEALGGLSAGIVGTVLGYPLDTSYVPSIPTWGSARTKWPRATHISAFSSSFLSSSVKARQQIVGTSGIVSTARHIVTNEGPASLYRGLVPPLISLSILNTVNFALYSYFQQHFTRIKEHQDVPLRGQSTTSAYSDVLQGFRWENALAGAAVGAFAGIVSTIENLVKTQLQIDNLRTAPRYRGSRDCVQQLLHQGYVRGIRTLYTGHGVNTAREMVFLATYFGVYEGLREGMYHDHVRRRESSSSESSVPTSTNNGNQSSHPWMIPLAGGLAGAVAWTVSFPLDCIRAGVQGQDLLGSHDSSIRKSAPTVFRTLLVERGIKGLYSGVAPSIVRAFLVSGSRFTAYEAALWFLRGGRDNVT